MQHVTFTLNIILWIPSQLNKIVTESKSQFVYQMTIDKTPDIIKSLLFFKELPKI